MLKIPCRRSDQCLAWFMCVLWHSGYLLPAHILTLQIKKSYWRLDTGAFGCQARAGILVVFSNRWSIQSSHIEAKNLTKTRFQNIQANCCPNFEPIQISAYISDSHLQMFTHMWRYTILSHVYYDSVSHKRLNISSSSLVFQNQEIWKQNSKCKLFSPVTPFEVK